MMEPLDFGDRWLDGPFKGRVQPAGSRFGRLIDGQPTAGGGGGSSDFAAEAHYREVFADALADDYGPASNLRAMDREGVDVAVHFPSAGLIMLSRDDTPLDLAIAICRGYNNWAADYCSADPTRLKAIAMIPLQDPSEAAVELRRATQELGHVGVFMPPNPVEGRRLDDPVYDPIYAAAQDLSVPIALHSASGSRLPQVSASRTSRFGHHIAMHPMEQMLACLTLVGDGLLERFSRLTVAHFESSCGWLPFWLERIDEHFTHYRWSQGRVAPMTRLPSEIFKTQCFISTEAGEEMVEDVVKHVGEDVLVVATDYPHSDAVDKFPDHTIGDLTRSQHVSAEAKRKILWDNPARLFGITDVPSSAAAVSSGATAR
jgi:predicted TIM-barrel fold metal-dependent hydrolase